MDIAFRAVLVNYYLRGLIFKHVHDILVQDIDAKGKVTIKGSKILRARSLTRYISFNWNEEFKKEMDSLVKESRYYIKSEIKNSTDTGYLVMKPIHIVLAVIASGNIEIARYLLDLQSAQKELEATQQTHPILDLKVPYRDHKINSISMLDFAFQLIDGFHISSLKSIDWVGDKEFRIDSPVFQRVIGNLDKMQFPITSWIKDRQMLKYLYGNNLIQGIGLTKFVTQYINHGDLEALKYMFQHSLAMENMSMCIEDYFLHFTNIPTSTRSSHLDCIKYILEESHLSGLMFPTRSLYSMVFNECEDAEVLNYMLNRITYYQYLLEKRNEEDTKFATSHFKCTQRDILERIFQCPALNISTYFGQSCLLTLNTDLFEKWALTINWNNNITPLVYSTVESRNKSAATYLITNHLAFVKVVHLPTLIFSFSDELATGSHKLDQCLEVIEMYFKVHPRDSQSQLMKMAIGHKVDLKVFHLIEKYFDTPFIPDSFVSISQLSFESTKYFVEHHKRITHCPISTLFYHRNNIDKYMYIWHKFPEARPTIPFHLHLTYPLPCIEFIHSQLKDKVGNDGIWVEENLTQCGSEEILLFILGTIDVVKISKEMIQVIFNHALRKNWYNGVRYLLQYVSKEFSYKSIIQKYHKSIKKYQKSASWSHSILEIIDIIDTKFNGNYVDLNLMSEKDLLNLNSIRRSLPSLYIKSLIYGEISIANHFKKKIN